MEKVKELAKLRVVLEIPGMDQVQIRKDVIYRVHDGDALGLDVYSPPNPDGPLPAVVFVVGYNDAVAMAMAEYRLKEWGVYVSWAQLAAASGFVGITYSSATPPEDAKAVLAFVRDHAADLNVDPARIGLWVASGNGPTALSLLTNSEARLRFAVMCNTYMLDLDGDSTVSDMAATFGFAAPNAGRTVNDLDSGTPIFLVRSGRDEVPGINGTIDRFVSSALEANRAISVINLPDAPHSFDTLHNTGESREIIRRALAFMRSSVVG